MLEAFAERRINAGEAEIHLRMGGKGPPLLLLHGYPQTHVIWHKLAPRLSTRFNVVAADTWSPVPSRELRDRYYPRVALRGEFGGHRSFYDSAKAQKVLQ